MLQKQRAMDSATAFVHGMFPDAASVSIPYAPIDNDPLLRFFKLCAAYKQYKQRVQQWMVRRMLLQNQWDSGIGMHACAASTAPRYLRQ